MQQTLRYLPDWILLILQLGGIALAAHGLGRTTLSLLAIAGTVLGIAGKLGLAQEPAVGNALVPILSTLTLSLSIWGYWTARARLHWNRIRWSAETIAQISIFACSLFFWTIWMGDTDGLPSHHDGIVHSVFFLRVWEQGIFPLTHGSLPLAETFGAEPFQNYPAGAHLLANLLSLPHRLLLSPLGVPISNYLKATLILACSALPVLVFQWSTALARSILSKQPLACLGVGLVGATVALTYFRFPVVATDQGGWSRIIALSSVWLWAGQILVLRPTADSRRYWWLVLLGTFYLHPQAFVAAALVIGFVWLRDLRNTQERLLWMGSGLLVLALGWWIAPYTQSSAGMAEIFPARAASLESVLGRISFFVGQSIFGEPYAKDFSLLSRRVIGAIGLVFFLLRPRASHARWVLGWLGILTLLSLSIFFPWPQLRVLGAPFYHQPDRMAEIFYLPLAMGWAMGSTLLFLGFQKLQKHISKNAARLLAVGFGILLIQGVGGKTWSGFWNLKEHFRHYGEVHRSPRFSNDGASIERLAQQLSGSPTLLVAAPDVTDSWPFRLPSQSHVQSLFTFGECPIGGAEIGILFKGHCGNRMAFYKKCKEKGQCPPIAGVSTLMITEPAAERANP